MTVLGNKRFGGLLMRFISSLYLLFAVHISLYAQWSIKTSGTNADLIDVHFINPTVGYACGYVSDAGGIIIKSNDGGENWFIQLSGTDFIPRSIYFIDENTGWVAGDAGGNEARILKTTNGGTNWLPINVGSFLGLFSIYFTDQNHGWAVGNFGTIISTTDGGNNWTAQSGTSNSLLSVYFIDNLTGWAAGLGGTVLKTTNSGNNWVSQTIGTNITISDISFINTNSGWMVGQAGSYPNFEGVCYKSLDGGSSWSKTHNGQGYYLSGVDFPQVNTGWAVGFSGKIISTTDAGDNWSPQQSGTVNRINSITFYDKYLGWAVADQGTILKTLNGGGLFSKTSLTTSASAGSQSLEVESTSEFSIGDNIVINSGRPNEETNTIIGFGSILLQTPLQFNHSPGELILTVNPTSINEKRIYIPNEFVLYQNYPNPFNPTTSISYRLPAPSDVELTVYNALGQKVATLVKEKQPAGQYSVNFDAGGLASGVYYCRLQAGNFRQVKKMLLIR
ncbi:MAG TPA: T9SS type A sorting domain-containing protein [Caldithrix abyssi]|uniref:T9SS type A sorting domain-containing protein n=1 Tax=Caldithrix abyssi TaxID=187145 RepID=A0A7V4WV05_CALAY|nr:T9SS type A sorting domain-containing protein [Caldithrix abyssi]